MAVTVGVMIGMGIFRTPGEVAAAAGDPALYLSLWLAGGLFVILSTAVVAEVMSLTDLSGGVYALVRRGVGPYPAFVAGWVDWLAYPATISLKAVVFAEFLVLLLPDLASLKAAIAATVVIGFAALQFFGVEAGGKIQTSAAIGLLCIVLLSLASLFSAPAGNLGATLDGPAGGSALAIYGLAAASIVFTLDGWLSGSYFGGEVVGGGTSVARGSIRAVTVVALLFLLMNAGLVWALGTGAMAGDDLPLRTALETRWGAAGGHAVVIALLLVLLAGINVHYMAGPRVLYALSVDGLGVDGAASVGERGNPLVAVLLTASASLAMLLLGGFETLLNLATLLFIFLYLMVLVSVALLRRSEPDLPRPVRAWAYPYSLLLTVAGWIAIGGFIGFAAPETAFTALIIALVSGPAYLAVKRLHQARG